MALQLLAAACSELFRGSELTRDVAGKFMAAAGRRDREEEGRLRGRETVEAKDR